MPDIGNRTDLDKVRVLTSDFLALCDLLDVGLRDFGAAIASIIATYLDQHEMTGDKALVRFSYNLLSTMLFGRVRKGTDASST